MDDLKWSRYNFLWNSEKHGKLLYNSYTNGFLKLDDSLFQDLNTISKNDNNLLDQLFSVGELQYYYG